MSTATWTGLFIACVILSLAPGSGAVASMSSGFSHGFWKGYWNVVGLQLGLLFQIVVVAVGLGAVLATSPLAFEILKWLGVFYLAYLGVRLWVNHSAPATETETSREPHTRPGLVLQGFLVNVSNPKSFVFMFAVLPQFISPQHPLLPQYSIFAATIVVIDSVVMAGYTMMGTKVLRLFQSERQRKVIDRIYAVLFLLIAAFLALQQQGG